jgi:hypothetical protein
LWEAELAQGRLESSGLISRIDQRGAIGVLGPGYMGSTVRGVALLVPSDRVAEAREFLDLGEDTG